MCLNPSHIWVERGPTHERIPTPCGGCWQCKARRVNDYVGRSLAEASTSQATCAITLTYAPRDDLADKVLTPPHFQAFVRALRKRGHSIRYLVAGEYGDLRGRAHFHAIIFWQSPPPEWPAPDKHGRIWIDEWPHGHVNVDWTVSHKSLRYVCKYVLKGESDQYWFSLSKKPSLGAAYFESRAQRMAELGVWPTSFQYSPPGAAKGISYFLSGATRRDFLARIQELRDKKPDPSKINEWVAKSYEKIHKWQHLRNCEATPDDQFMDEMIERLAFQSRLLASENEAQRKKTENARIDRALKKTLDSLATNAEASSDGQASETENQREYDWR